MNRMMAIGGILTLVLGLAMLVLPGGRIPLLDANRTILAESERDGYCGGLTYLETRGGGNANSAAKCRAKSSLPDQIDLNSVQPAFCRALRSSMSMTQTQCMDIMEGRQYWPTKDGSIADSWNRRFPYPGGMMAKQGVDNSRTGDRDTTERGDIQR